MSHKSEIERNIKLGKIGDSFFVQSCDCEDRNVCAECKLYEYCNFHSCGLSAVIGAVCLLFGILLLIGVFGGLLGC